MELTRNSVVVRQWAMSPVKGRIETCDLWERRTTRKKCANGCEIVRLMQRRQRNQCFESRQYCLVDQNGPVILWTAMNDPVSNGYRIDTQLVAQPSACDRERSWDILYSFRG